MQANKPSYFIAFCMGLFMQFGALVYSVAIHFTVIEPSGIEYSEETCFWYHLPSLVLLIWSTLIMIFYPSHNHHQSQTDT